MEVFCVQFDIIRTTNLDEICPMITDSVLHEYICYPHGRRRLDETGTAHTLSYNSSQRTILMN